jgi:hypothetical protein
MSRSSRVPIGEVAVRSRVRVSFVVLVVSALALVALSAPAAQASLGIAKFVGINCKATAETCGEVYSGTNDVFGSHLNETAEPKLAESEAEGYTQAAGHVPFGVTDFTVTHSGTFKEDNAVPSAIVTHVRVDVAPGLATSPVNVPQCTMKEFGEAGIAVAFGFFEAPECKAGGLGPHETGPKSTVIGEESATVYAGATAKDVVISGVLYNLESPKGRSALYGAALKLPIGLTKGVLEANGVTGAPAAKQYYAHTLVEGNVEWGKEAKGTGAGDYHDYFEVNVSPALPVIRSRQLDYGRAGNGAFITNGTNCPGNHTTTLSLESVPLGSEAEVAKSVASGAREFARKPYETLIGLQGCKNVPFAPTFNLSPGASGSDQPDQLTTEVTLPQYTGEEAEIDSSQLKTATITLPEGMTLNPSAAAGLEACTPAQARIHSEEFGVSCPAGSELGTVSLNVPTLPNGSLTGSIYLGGPESGPITGPPYTMYVVANSARYGVSVRLKAEVIPNLATGQLTTVFNENPEQPFSNLTLHFNRGALTSVANPLICGTPLGSTSFTPVATEGVPTANAGFGVPITGCAPSIPFSLSQSTQYEPPNGGAHSSYTFNLNRPEGQQYLQKVSTTLPSGVVGEIPDLTLCGEPQAAQGTCGSASKIGTATITDGSGSSPYTFSGPVYMTGPYNGAPFGLSIAVPAVAGPFNLGTIVTRSTININPTTARVTAESVLPTIVGGIPIRLRSLSVNVNRQGFLLNPTNCAVEATESTLESTFKTVQTGLSSPFQAEGCSGLAFKPAFTASTGAKHSKTQGASLVTTLAMPGGQSNIKSVFVTLPKQLPSRLTTLQKACLLKVFEANPLNCKKESPGSEVGSATAITPTLSAPMKGPAFLVSHAGEAFPSLELVLEGQGVRVILEGKTNIKKGITTTNFASTPDVPVSSVTVNLPLGPHSALTTEKLTTNLCTAKLTMPTVITGQNGKVVKYATKINPSGCGVQIVGHKVVGNTLYLTVQTYAAGRVSGSGSGLSTIFRKVGGATRTTLKVPLSSGGRGRRRPFKVKVRVGFVPKKKGAHSSASVTVSFR